MDIMEQLAENLLELASRRPGLKSRDGGTTTQAVLSDVYESDNFAAHATALGGRTVAAGRVPLPGPG